MTDLKNKSIENIECAELLIQEGFHSSSVHCSYYACYQRLNCELYERYGWNFEEQESNNSHGYTINQFYKRHRVKNRKLAKDISTMMFALKKDRKIADYDNIRVGESTANNVYIKAKEILNLFSK